MKKQEYQERRRIINMADRLEFKEKLAGILALAEGQNGKITVDEVEKYFEEDGLSQEQMNLVCDYLLSMSDTNRPEGR